jgi:hypothetical protein
MNSNIIKESIILNKMETDLIKKTNGRLSIKYAQDFSFDKSPIKQKPKIEINQKSEGKRKKSPNSI